MEAAPRGLVICGDALSVVELAGNEVSHAGDGERDSAVFRAVQRRDCGGRPRSAAGARIVESAASGFRRESSSCTGTLVPLSVG